MTTCLKPAPRCGCRAVHVSCGIRVGKGASSTYRRPVIARVWMEPGRMKLVYKAFPMPKSLRKFIVCLLVLALPAPGFAAAGMLACSPGHARVMTAPALDAMAVEAAQASSHDHGAHPHALGDAPEPALQDATAGHTAQVSDAVSGAGALDSQAGTKCSACAACCFGAALVPGSVLPGTPEFSPTPLTASSPAPVSFITDGPVRPPRSFPA